MAGHGNPSQRTEYDIDLVTEAIINPGFTYSDHSSFWDYGYPAILGIEDYQPWLDSQCYEANDNYHRTSDTLDTLNMALITKTTQLAVATIAELAVPTPEDGAFASYLPLFFAYSTR